MAKGMGEFILRKVGDGNVKTGLYIKKSQLLQYNQLIVVQYLNYVFNYVCHIFSMQHSYIVLYCMPNFAFILIFNILDIEVHCDCHVFTVHRVYNGQNFYIYHTVSFRIHA